MNSSSTMLHTSKTRRVAQIERLGFFFLPLRLSDCDWLDCGHESHRIREAKGIEPLIAHSPLLSWG